MNYKRILASAMCLCIALPTAGTIPEMCVTSIAADKMLISDIFMYNKYDDHIEITATSTMAEGGIAVPSEIDGLPVTAIGEHGLAGISKVTSISLPRTITSIGKQAFFGDTALEYLNIPAVPEIPDEAFLNCASLTYIYLPNSVKKIGVRAFCGCSSLKFFDMSGVESIAAQAFDNSGITAFRIPKTMKRIEKDAFYGCTSITEMTIPDNINYIAARALPSSLKKLTINNPDCELEEDIFKYLPKKCRIIGHQNSTVIEFAKANDYTFEIIGLGVPGDVNDDTNFNVADLVMMKNYLIGKNALTSKERADFNNDGFVDIFDYISMLSQFSQYPDTSSLTAKNLSLSIQSKSVDGSELDDDFILSQTDFALSLFRHEAKADTNTLVSPYSVMQALAMTANGAGSYTKEEMENVLGLPMDRLNKYLYTQRTTQHNDSKSRLTTANSIWARDDVKVKDDFLQTNVDYYDADFYVAPFDDSTKDEINDWVNQKTDEMIPEVLDNIAADAVMYLVNAVAFDAKWENEFEKENTIQLDFTSFDNQIQKTDFMCGQESYYISDADAQGFYKYYSGRRYAFAAVVPDEMPLSEYIGGLTSEGLNNMLTNKAEKNFLVRMPKFSYDFKTILNGSLCDMGMPSAFGDGADFSNMFEDVSACINRVIHKTHIDVDEAGTKAAAATVVEMTKNDAVMMPKDEINFDKPFVYFIIDTETNIPVFIGTLSSIE